MTEYGFIITRHVNSEKTNRYWNRCVQCIRYFYQNIPIIIIDDNSNKEFITSDFPYSNIRVIESEYPSRGELLPYYYLIKHKFFKYTIIIHDSVFIHRYFPFEIFIKSNIKVLPLWFFHPDKENIENTIRLTDQLHNNISIRDKLMNDNILGLQHTKWYGCFGVQSFISLEFLLYIEEKYKITNLIHHVHCRKDRCSLERIFGCIFFTENSSIQYRKSLLGNILHYMNWGYTYDDYNNNLKNKLLIKPIIKVWTGR
jgi:hypothetical protein